MIVRNAIRCRSCKTEAVSEGDSPTWTYCECGLVAAGGGQRSVRRIGTPQEYEELLERAGGREPGPVRQPGRKGPGKGQKAKVSRLSD